MLVYDQDHDFRAEGGLAAKRFKTTSVVIGNNIWIGVNSIILQRTAIGDNCVIGARCIIKETHDGGTIVIQKHVETIREIVMQEDDA